MLAFLLTACTAGTASGGVASFKTGHSGLPDYGPAPELHNAVWLNTSGPLKLADLRGKVVALEMWTFDCINCKDEIPWLKDWYQKYSGDGLVIIGNHMPEFAYEQDLNNLKAAVARLGIQYPVAQDNDSKTWDAYQTQYWPTFYLIDKAGHIRFRKIGEGNEEDSEAAIQELLRENYP